MATKLWRNFLELFKNLQILQISNQAAHATRFKNTSSVLYSYFANFYHEDVRDLHV